jgi:hypothetical protein
MSFTLAKGAQAQAVVQREARILDPREANEKTGEGLRKFDGAGDAQYAACEF